MKIMITICVLLALAAQTGFQSAFKAADKLRKQRQYVSARAAFEKLYLRSGKRDEKFTAGLYIAYCYRDAKKYDNAISQLKKLRDSLKIKSSDKLAVIYLQYAALYCLKKDYLQARQWARKVLSLQDVPRAQVKIAYYNIGRSYFLDKKYPEALQAFNKAKSVEADPAKCGRCTFKSISAYIKSTKKNLKQKKQVF